MAWLVLAGSFYPQWKKQCRQITQMSNTTHLHLFHDLLQSTAVASSGCTHTSLQQKNSHGSLVLPSSVSLDLRWRPPDLSFVGRKQCMAPHRVIFMVVLHASPPSFFFRVVVGWLLCRATQTITNVDLIISVQEEPTCRLSVFV